MAISCGIIGMIVVAFLNLTASSVPLEALQVTAVKRTGAGGKPAENTVMPVIFWAGWRAIDAGKNQASGRRFSAAPRS